MDEDTRDMTVTLVSVTFDMVIQGQAKTYTGTEVVYRTANGQVNTKNMHSNVLKFNKALKADLEAVQPGDTVSVATKKEGDFVNWVSVKKTTALVTTEAVAKTATNVATVATQSTPTQAAVRSNYETPEERTLRQRLIVRQSSLANAIALFALDKDYIPTSDAVIQTAKEFEAYVYGEKTPMQQMDDRDAADAYSVIDGVFLPT